MTKSRTVFFAAVTVTVVGVAAALSALYLGPARAAVGPLPAQALVLPADSRFVMGFDVKRVVASPLYARLPEHRLTAFHEMEETLGLNPERDLEQVVLGGRGGAEGMPTAVVIGTFDRQKLGRAVETQKKERVTWKTVEGTTVYFMDEGSPKSTAAAFLDDRAIVMGSASNVQAAVTARAQSLPGLRGNTTLSPLLEKIKPGSAFWMVGDQNLLANLPKTVPGAAGDNPMTLPSLQSLSVTGDLDPLVAVSITGETADPATANSLADIVRGLVGFLALQASAKPELKDLASAITVATEENRVLVNARIPYSLLDAMQPPRRTGVAPGAPSPAIK
jgi:hypothetical protein